MSKPNRKKPTALSSSVRSALKRDRPVQAMSAFIDELASALPPSPVPPAVKQDGVAFGAALLHLTDAERILKGWADEMAASQLDALHHVANRVAQRAKSLAILRAVKH